MTEKSIGCKRSKEQEWVAPAHCASSVTDGAGLCFQLSSPGFVGFPVLLSEPFLEEPVTATGEMVLLSMDKGLIFAMVLSAPAPG